MKAVVVHAKGDLRIEDRPDPEPGPGQVLVAVHWGGICGSDLAYVNHGASGTAILRTPLVLGHEIAGEVVGVGAGVSEQVVGTRAAIYPPTPVSGEPLPDRLAGRTNLHRRVSYLGSADPHTDGGFSQLLVVRTDQVRALPANVDTRTGALAEPMGVALHAIRRAESVLPGGLAGREILVNGCGPIGLLVIALARHLGAGPITGADLTPSALDLARALGADQCVQVPGEALPESEVVFEASGAPAALGGVLGATARGGLMVQVGNLPAAPAPSALGALVSREITWLGSYRFTTEMTEAIELLGQGLDVSALITHTFDLTHLAEAFATATDRQSGSSKVLLDLST
ncbi:L-idonate 5-dehydrogenase [Pseudactinotalea sp. Z1739]|uniref:L-idonate 5-dehydrogenase n=1 Tax=Pseudactinotalea sp. Z1739 TaxID=3413028 RepID=UPI003C7BD7C2